MYCTNCGNEINDNTLICSNCGTEVNNHNLVDNENTIGALGILCFIIPILGLILYYSWKSEKPKKAKKAVKSAIWGFVASIVIFFIPGVIIGIQMFDTQVINAQRTAIAEDLQSYGSNVLSYYNTPAEMGGGKNVEFDIDTLSKYLGFNISTHSLENSNGVYTISESSQNNSIIIYGFDDPHGMVKLKATITPSSNDVQVTLAD